MSQKTAVIIGAGYGGIALANLLGKSGYRVTVLEKNSSLGGRIHLTKKDGYMFDLGPSWYLMPEVFDQYYGLFAASAQERLDLLRFGPGYKVYFEDNEPIVIHGDVSQDKTTFERIEPGAGKALERYVAHSSRVYHTAVREFLYSNFDRVRDVLNMTVLKNAPAMVSLILQPLHRYVAKRFHDLRLHQLLEYHMVFLGSSPFQAPAIYMLMSHLDYRSGVYYPRRGMVSLIDDLIDLGSGYDITYRTDSPVQEILATDGVATGVRLESGEAITADVVVSNADLHHTETVLLAPEHQTYPESYWQRRQSGPGALLVSFGVRGKLPQLLHHNLYFVKDWRQNFSDIYETKTVPEQASIYVCNPSKTDPSLAPEGCENLFILVPIPAGVTLSPEEESALADKVIRQFAVSIGEPDLADRIESKELFSPRDFGDRFNAWRFNAFGGESHLLSQSILFRTRNVSRRLKNLYYVGAGTLPGIGLPMCLISAELTYKRIMGKTGAGPLTEQEVG